MTASLDPELDLTVARIIAAPRSAVLEAWADPGRFEKWWVPAPELCRVHDMDLRPGGSFRTEISQDGLEPSSASSSPTLSSPAGDRRRSPS